MGYPLQYSWDSLVAQLVKNLPAMQETWVGKIPWRRERLPTPAFWPGEFHGLYSLQDHKESDGTERLSLHFDNQVDLGQGKEENPVEPLQTSPQAEILPLDPLL